MHLPSRSPRSHSRMATIVPLVKSETVEVVNSRLRGLDGLRAVAALFVFVYHLRWIAGEPRLQFAGIELQTYMRQLDLGVCIFFVLSGFLLSKPFWMSLNENGSLPAFREYLLRRLVRVYPAYVLILICFASVQSSTYSLWGMIGLLQQLLGLHTFADFSFNGAVPVLWTIGIEIQFYLVLPFLFWVLARLPFRRPLLHIGTLLVLTVSAQTLWPFVADTVYYYLPARYYSPKGPVRSSSVFHFLPWFFFGIASARLSIAATWRSLSERRVNGVCAVSTLYLGAAVLWGNEGGWRNVGIWGWPAMPAACAALIIGSTQSVIAGRLLDSGIMRTLGIWSYGIYLWHWPVLKAVFGGTLPGRLSPSVSFIVCGGLALCVTCLISALTWRFVESPAMRSARSIPK